MSFRSSKSKGEPLLKRDVREEGGDDIDFDRRMLTSSDESTYGVNFLIFFRREISTHLWVNRLGLYSIFNVSNGEVPKRNDKNGNKLNKSNRSKSP